MDIKAIETWYAGVKFRSRLEARWAVFFDALGVKWHYEHEGYDLGDGTFYLPDFWLPQVKMWAEVKPVEFTPEEFDKCRLLSKGTKHECLLLVGVPEDKPYDAIGADPNSEEFVAIPYCLTCHHGYVTDEGRFYSCPAEDERFDDTAAASLKARTYPFAREPGGDRA